MVFDEVIQFQMFVRIFFFDVVIKDMYCRSAEWGGRLIVLHQLLDQEIQFVVVGIYF